MPDTLLVTGASGFVAAHIIKDLLFNGYSVRGTVRSASSANKVQEAHADYAGSKLSLVTVTDIAAPGAFLDAAAGVDAIIHTASPFVLDAVDFEKELYQPAVNGTLEALKAASANKSVKRVVVTSSFAAVGDFLKGTRPGYVYTEKDWNPMTKEEAVAAGPVLAYCLSKALAERAAFDYVEREKPAFDIVTLCPPMVYGPIAQTFDDMHKLNESTEDIYNLINGLRDEVPATGFWAYADVRDLAVAHRRAYEVPPASNQRYLITNGSYSNQRIADTIAEVVPGVAGRLSTRRNAANEAWPDDVYKLDNTKATTELGIEWRSFESTIEDTVTALLDLEKALGV